MEQYRQKKVVIDPGKPATWDCHSSIRNIAGKPAFDFIERLKKFGGTAYALDLLVRANDESADISYTASEQLEVNGEKLEKVVKQLQDLMEGSQVVISAEKIKFDQGQQLTDWFADLKRQLNPGEVRQ